ncbi:S8 family serine peptidase [Actinokineospora guangxiensis]|uniref:S8 family serine peptidase n=1 Tax=Actinokineospora guangxiensis TaxID=1490288 RepID=A0ABW0ELD9_9PSEU
MRRARAAVIPVVLAVAAAIPALPAAAAPPVEYSVLLAEGADPGPAVRAVVAAGGTVISANAPAGLVTATASADLSSIVDKTPGVEAVARSRPIGQAPKAPALRSVEREHHLARAGRNPRPGAAAMDPLDTELWGLTAVRSHLARTEQPGDKRVRVGVLDTGVDAAHPDIAANFDRQRSRNFARDLPADDNGVPIDGPCEARGCVDPADVDENGHGTHVAATIAAPADGFGISGVAPNVSIVNIRGGQDSGYFFLQPVIDGITYAADAGIDVLNMSFYIDPWLYHCESSTADTPDQRIQQRIAIRAVRRAMAYADHRGVTMIVSVGNEHTDLGAPGRDADSPNFPPGSEHDREIDNDTCFVLPVENEHAIGVAAVGPTMAKADYANHGAERVVVTAPGGYFRDGLGTDWYRTNENLILSAYPREVAVRDGAVGADGEITTEGAALGVRKACRDDGTCGYYQYLQGTSMAAPHASGVAALIVAEFGAYRPDDVRMPPASVRRILESTAAPLACPVPATVDYADVDRPAEYTATCTGTTELNSFHGHGIVDAWNAVTRGKP